MVKKVSVEAEIVKDISCCRYCNTISKKKIKKKEIVSEHNYIRTQ